jgi:hypothetical protein
MMLPADGRARATGLGHTTFFPRDVGLARDGGEVAEDLMPAAEVTMMSAIHSLR